MNQDKEKILFMFPGVGSQYAGMGKTLFDRFAVFRQTLEEAGDILHMDFEKLCFKETDKKEQAKLENAQLTIMVFSVALFKVYMQEIGVNPDFCAGHSLGEYSALCCARALRFPDALLLVQQRGNIISEVSSKLDGTMMWVINLDHNVVENVCRQVSVQNRNVYISAYDSPTQTSISGHKDVVMTAAKRLEKEGAIVYPLQMSGPFHCPLMQEAADRMKGVLTRFSYAPPIYTVVANRDARPYTRKESIVENLSSQLISPIRWMDSIQYLVSQGVGVAVEIGPKDVLKFLMKKNAAGIQPYTMDNESDVHKLKDRFLVPETDYLNVIGRCLGAAVGTKNRNQDPARYEVEVVKPYKEVAAMYEEFKLQGKTPSATHVENSLNMLRRVLTAKQVPPSEQDRAFRKVLQGRVSMPRQAG